MVGTMYEYGKGVSIDKEKAFKWYKKSAEQNFDSSQVALGRMYYNGYSFYRYQIKSDVKTEEVKVFKKDYNKAFEWFLKAANQDNDTAQFGLGIMYYYGYGVKQDMTKAKKWIEEAIKNKRYLSETSWESIFGIELNKIKKDFNLN